MKPSACSALQSALKLAKSGALGEALSLASTMEKRALSTEDLRQLALIYSHCGRERDAEEAWAAICTRADVQSGDCFMLASTQVGLGHPEKAIVNLRREIAASDKEKNLAYLSVSVIHLAYLLANKSMKSEALEVLSRIGDSEGTHVPGGGLVTKRALLARLGAGK